MAGRVRLLRSGDRTPGRSLGPFEAERPELVVDDVGADAAVQIPMSLDKRNERE